MAIRTFTLMASIIMGAVIYAADIPSEPGVYPQPDGKLLGVGAGKLHSSLRATHAARAALNAAERDAKRRIARYLFPNEFADGKSIVIDIRGSVRVQEMPAGNNTPALVAILAAPAGVSVRSQADASVIVDARQVAVAPAMFSWLTDPLLQLGGARIYEYRDGWLAVAVGQAPLSGGDSIAERNALKAARVEAGKNLADVIFGSTLNVLEDEAESVQERNGIASMRQWTRSVTRETIEGKMNHAVEAGHWFTNDDYAAVVLVVSQPQLEPEFLAGYHDNSSDNEQTIPEYPDWDVEPEWEFVLLDCPRLLRGGAVLYPQPDGLWAVGVGAGKLSGNVATDRINAPRAAEMDARGNIIKYLTGFSTASKTEDVRELEIILDQNGLESSSVIESLQKVTREQTTGRIHDLRRVGSWKSLDGKLLYQIHIVNLF